MAENPLATRFLERSFGADLAPRFSLIVEGTAINADITQYIQGVSFESAIDMADLMEIHVTNPGVLQEIDPDTGKPHIEFSSHKVFQPGNEVELRAGYGDSLKFIGRAILTKHLPDFPEGAIPTLTIKGYDKSQLMMDVAGPVLSSQENKIKVRTPRFNATNDDQGHLYANLTASEIVEQVAKKYNMATVIDKTDKKLLLAQGDGIVQKKGMKDYELVKILGNLNRREFFVNYDPTNGKGGWVLNWVKPADNTNAQFTFQYGAGDDSTLLSFSCEYGLREQMNEVAVLAWDKDNQRWVSVLLLHDVEGDDPKWRLGGNRMERNKETSQHQTAKSEFDLSKSTKKPGKGAVKSANAKKAFANVQGNSIKKAITSATEFRLAAMGTAIDVQCDRPFKDIQDAATFCYRWFKARQDHFLIGQGKIIGLESLRARQVHRLEGLGPRLSGDWYFIKVTHHFDSNAGYRCEFTARKVLTGNEQPELGG